MSFMLLKSFCRKYDHVTEIKFTYVYYVTEYDPTPISF